MPNTKVNSLEIDSVTLSFNGRKVLSDIYLKCDTGEIVGLIGRNGAGKSCLLKLLFGSLQGENQSIRLNKTYSRKPYAIPRTIHYLHQDGFAMPYLSFEDLAGSLSSRKTFKQDPRDQGNSKK